jgi:hypothetical protein
MAFNSSNYVKDVDKPFTNRIVDPIVNSTTYGLPTSTATIATATADAMINTGLSPEQVTALVASRTDNVVNGGADEFYAIAGKDPTRAARVSLQKLTRDRISTKDYLNNVNPQTKIAAFRSDNSIEIITVL